MISKQEIMALAAELQLQAHVVEKDYALGWFLAGISAHPVIGPRWVFKGGTCLKCPQDGDVQGLALSRSCCVPRRSSRRRTIMLGMHAKVSLSVALPGWRWRKPSA
jgi:hypothetical protein